VKVRLDLAGTRLRAALVDLLEEAGHVVAVGGRPEGVGLQILGEPGTGTPWPGIPTLYLRPGRGLDVSEPSALERASMLRDAISTRGAATWSGPLDPDVLLEALGPGAPRRRSPAVPADAPLSSAQDAWLVIDARTREVMWATDSGRTRFVAPGGGVLSERGVGALPADLLEREHGHELRTIEGRPHLVVWWTDPRGRRCVGVLRVPSGGARAAGDNLETLAELGRVSATLAHEIRNPLAAFAGALDLLEHEADEGERAEIAGLARQRLERTRTMLDEALRIVHPLQGEPERVSAEEVVRSAIGSVRTDARFDRVELHVETAPGSRDVLAHPGPLREAVLNLLVNAAQAQSGVGRVTIRVEPGERYGLIRVQDEGPGIPPAVREKVFAPFWTTKEHGTGLGLAYVQRVARAAGGSVSVEDCEKGACVRLELPFADAR
jgi:signal transduction histidine kinase